MSTEDATLHITPTQEEPAPPAVDVLVVDDDLMFRRILKTWLEKWGYRVTTAENGEQAWKILKTADAPRLLILDWMMPTISGVDLCRLIRSRPGPIACYILLATSKDHTLDLIQGLEAGADDYLSKPFDKNELQTRLTAGQRALTVQG